MKRINLFLGSAIIAVAFASCKSENEKQAEKTVDAYEKYVDSVTNVAVADAKANWQSIEVSYNQKTADAEAALAEMKDKANAEARLEKSKAKYAGLKSKLEAEAQAEKEAQAANPANRKQLLRDAYFGAGKIGEDMDFSWVNKDNILRVYNDFYNEFDKNKDTYSREDFDEIKAMYEALDAHKNKVEKEGLSSKDNLKIAELKFKFAPKFKWERMGAKAEENQKAKE
ncbi:MAG: hypothetical protein BGO88_12305 [Flavobacterium sp. 38-13]|jgi:hypothetical protein|uniref:hypothetical protein n=1 Tax=Flavobacterium sp. 38-13 TaxID=1896168 RepID=UPI000964EE16|nr:hypothetical protein [Flavobacterium sp. 38-13]OJX54419.1 MAG: hypothetical protein BGO88_12305 [Flavobacterium sp. 38-13]